MGRRAIHPGEHLAKQHKGLGMSAAELARQLKVPTIRMTEIVNGQQAVPGDTALRLGPIALPLKIGEIGFSSPGGGRGFTKGRMLPGTSIRNRDFPDPALVRLHTPIPNKGEQFLIKGDPSR